MRDLEQEPLCEAQDLGKPIADSPHAVSVCLPLWEHVIGYETGDPDIIESMWCGYPRFVMHPKLKELHEQLLSEYGKEEEACLAFCEVAAAVRCQKFIAEQGRVISLPNTNLAALFFPESLNSKVSEYRRHTGEIVSSRQAQAFLSGRENPPELELEVSIKQRLAEWNNQSPDHIFLYGNGMAAHYHLHRAVQSTFEGDCSIQFGFPYVDILKVQQKFPPGVHFIWDHSEEGFAELATRLRQGGVVAVYVELPNNPLLSMPDGLKLSELCRKHEVLLVIDDTVGSYANIDSFRIADVTYSSLTKYFNGACDAMGGAVIVNQHSPFKEQILNALEEAGGDGLYGEDTVILEKNSRDYPERISCINQTAERLAEFLNQHPKVKRVFYPKYQSVDRYDTLRKPGGGYGGLLSIELKCPEQNTPAFYDALKVNKGPTLGTDFTLVCPYTLLAHYEELEWVESCGVSRWLVRVSVGLEESSELIHRFSSALEVVS